MLKTFVVKGFLSPKGVAHWRVLGREESPQPRPDEVVSFLAFHECGLGYPTHWFLRGLLNEWGLELQHLNPTGVGHIAGFVTVYEAFLGELCRWGILPRSRWWGFRPAEEIERGRLVSRVHPL